MLKNKRPRKPSPRAVVVLDHEQLEAVSGGNSIWGDPHVSEGGNAIWGDPHVHESDGGTWDVPKP